MVESQTQAFCFENPTRLLILKWINTTERKLTWPDTHRPAKKKPTLLFIHTTDTFTYIILKKHVQLHILFLSDLSFYAHLFYLLFIGGKKHTPFS